jgi:NADP-dependent 3-hydroxy acid dehydrogenase YdfG
MKTLVVTGASSGVGLEISKLFVNNGWSVIGLARNLDNLELIKSELGEQFIPLRVDVSLSDSVKNAFDYIHTRFVSIDCLVNNAAVFMMKPFSESTIEDIDRIIDVNLKGTMYCTLNALKLVKPNVGRIINIGSVAGEHGIRNQSIYCASKFGVDGFADALNQELLDNGISLSTICPGGINTPLWNPENPYPGGDTSQLLSAYDIAKLVAYIAAQPTNVVLKKIVAFPSNEWH